MRWEETMRWGYWGRWSGQVLVLAAPWCCNGNVGMVQYNTPPPPLLSTNNNNGHNVSLETQSPLCQSLIRWYSVHLLPVLPGVDCALQSYYYYDSALWWCALTVVLPARDHSLNCSNQSVGPSPLPAWWESNAGAATRWSAGQDGQLRVVTSHPGMCSFTSPLITGAKTTHNQNNIKI